MEYKTRNIPRKHKTTTISGKREYMKRYMQIRRAELRKLQIQFPLKITRVQNPQSNSIPNLLKLPKLQRKKRRRQRK